MVKIVKKIGILILFINFCNAWSYPTKNNQIYSTVKLGIDNLLTEKNSKYLEGKRVGVITNQTGVTSNLESTITFLQNNSKKYNYRIAAIYTPEHGFKGTSRNLEKIGNSYQGKIPIYSLYGDNNRPNESMLKDIDVIIYDIQDVGSRSFTYITTLFYAMEEAAKRNIKIIIADRPNPMGGNIIDGAMVESEWRSFYSYVNVPYCYGMTIGELAKFFNSEHKINCDLVVIPMEGWKRGMNFSDTGLHWIPPSAHIPEPETTFYYPMTGILGELNIVSIGVGYTLPFKVVGAPWIDSEKFARELSRKKLQGVKFIPYSFKPYYGVYSGEECHGIKIILTDIEKIKPVKVQFAIMEFLKLSYSNEFYSRLDLAKNKHEQFSQINGTNKVLEFIKRTDKCDISKIHDVQKQDFILKRQDYLIKEYFN